MVHISTCRDPVTLTPLQWYCGYHSQLGHLHYCIITKVYNTCMLTGVSHKYKPVDTVWEYWSITEDISYGSLYCSMIQPIFFVLQVPSIPTSYWSSIPARECWRIGSEWRTLLPSVQIVTATSKSFSPVERSFSSRPRRWRARPAGWPCSKLALEEVLRCLNLVLMQGHLEDSTVAEEDTLLK